MLLTNEKEILKAMESELKDASDSTIGWLAETFDVPQPSRTGFSRRKAAVSSQKQRTPSIRPAKGNDYLGRIGQLTKELRIKGLFVAEKDRDLIDADYTGVGYGYCLKTSYPKNPKTNTAIGLKRLEKLVANMGTP